MTSSDDTRLSDHPTDSLIRELIRTGREAAAAEIAQIIERMATAPFSRQIVPVLVRHRGLSYEGRVLGRREASLFYHLVKAVVSDQQWIAGTTASQYVADLAAAVRHPSAQIAVYGRRGGSIAAALLPTHVPLARRGPGALPWLYVVYSADRGTIVSGYQASSRDTLAIPENVRWLT